MSMRYKSTFIEKLPNCDYIYHPMLLNVDSSCNLTVSSLLQILCCSQDCSYTQQA